VCSSVRNGRKLFLELDDVKYHICVEEKEDLLEGEKELYSQ